MRNEELYHYADGTAAELEREYNQHNYQPNKTRQ